MREEDAYQQLQFYTLSLRDPAFIHQHVVDAWTAQHADESTKPIALTFSLVGLYLHCEREFNGRQVQRVHMILAPRTRDWPTFTPPRERGSITALDVMAAPAGPDRDRAINRWCATVWAAFGGVHQEVARLLERHGIG